MSWSHSRPSSGAQPPPYPGRHHAGHEDYKSMNSHDYQSMTSHSSLSIPSARGTPTHKYNAKYATRPSPFQQINSDDSQSTASSSHVRLGLID